MRIKSFVYKKNEWDTCRFWGRGPEGAFPSKCSLCLVLAPVCSNLCFCSLLSSVCPFPAVGGNLSFGEQHSVSFAQERRLMVPLMYFHSECVFVKG